MNPIILRITAIMATAAAYSLSTGTNNLWLLTWFAPLPILLLSFRTPALIVGLYALLAYLLGSSSLAQSLSATVPLPILLLFLLLPAVMFAVIILATRYAVLQTQHWSSLLVFPILWTAWDYLYSQVALYGLAYSQVDFHPAIQIVSITGMSGLVFLLTLFPAGLSVAWYFRGQTWQVIPALILAIVPVLGGLSYGWVRLARPEYGPRVRVGLAATDTTVPLFETTHREEALPVVQAYAQRVARLATNGAEVVVLPEKFVGVTSVYAEEVTDILAEVARVNRVTIIAGLNMIGEPKNRNVAIVFSSEGEIQAEYEKNYLVPGYEAGYQAGTALGLLSTPRGKWGVAICRDMDFPKLSRAYSQAEVGLMLVPAWDFVKDGRIHARMAVMRGVEGGYAIARTAQQGQLTVSDRYGHILDEASSSTEGETLRVVEVPTGLGSTFYARTGDWFAGLNIAAALAILVSLLLSYFRALR